MKREGQVCSLAIWHGFLTQFASNYGISQKSKPQEWAFSGAIFSCDLLPEKICANAVSGMVVGEIFIPLPNGLLPIYLGRNELKYEWEEEARPGSHRMISHQNAALEEEL